MHQDHRQAQGKIILAKNSRKKMEYIMEQVLLIKIEIGFVIVYGEFKGEKKEY
jgi:hypothetical protein